MTEDREHGKHGWFKGGPRSYGPLLKSDGVKMLWDSYGEGNKSRVSALYQVQHFLEINQCGPEEVLELSDEDLKLAVKRAVLKKRSEGKGSAARLMFYTLRRFFELNGREISFNRTEKKVLLTKKPKKIARQYIPTREDVYRMADSFPRKSERQQLRGKALILCLWQSGVRSGCLCSWRWGMFADQLYPAPKIPVRVKVVAYRPEGISNAAEDTKLSSYSVNYYFTFLHKEAADALKAYLDARRGDGWTPQPSDPVWVTEGTNSQDEPINPQHIIEVVKNAAQQVNIDPSSIWTHCFRKAFRKTLYRGGVDPDVAEALMGHKLPASRGSYFDYHDVVFAEEEYSRGYWSRVDISRLRQLEEQVAAATQNGQTKTDQISDLQTQIESLQSKLTLLAETTRELAADRSRLLGDPDVLDLLTRKRAQSETRKAKADKS